MKTVLRVTTVLALVIAMGGCATANRNPEDPYEGFNRSMFTFNDNVDRIAVKPAATVYKKAVPQLVQTGVGNFFGNLGDVWTGVNNLLQFKFEDGLNDFMRVAVNSTFGLGGLLDIGSEAGIQKHRVDFGQTLGYWGVKSGPYVVLPLFGPSTLRDALATPLDIAGDPWNYKRPIRWRTAGTLLRGVDLRASVLDASSLVEDAAIDRYEFVRDAYLQRRESRIDNRRRSPLKEDKSISARDDDDPSAPGKSTKPADASAGKELPAGKDVPAAKDSPAGKDSPTGKESPKGKEPLPSKGTPSSNLIFEGGDTPVTSADTLPNSVSSEIVSRQLTASTD